MSGDSWNRRQESLERLTSGRFDLLVVGAGIIGSRVAYEAASDGLRVALVDAGDFGGATSSASSKLLHGGLRYLSTGDVRLVRQLQVERRVVATRIAPHLSAQLPLVLAVERCSRTSSAKLNLALALYGTLAGLGRPFPRRLRVRAAGALIPSLRAESVSSCGIVTEALTHDARLTLATVHAAARAGARVASRVRVVELQRVCGRVAAAVLEDVLTSERLAIKFRSIVNATGPWIDEVRRLEASDAAPLVRLSKGVHVVLPLEGKWQAGLALFDDSGTAIAIPWQGMLLLGATDTPFEARPTHPVVHANEISHLLDRFANVLPREQLSPDRVAHSFAGLRVFARRPITTAREPRRHLIAVGPGEMVSIAGGKLTTHRLIAVDALRRLPAAVRPRQRVPREEPLASPCSCATETLVHSRLDRDAAAHLIRLYGEDVRRVLAYEGRVRNPLDRIDPCGPDIWAQVEFARDEEWALTVGDIVSRRTTVTVRGLASAGRIDAIRDRLNRSSRSRMHFRAAAGPEACEPALPSSSAIPENRVRPAGSGQ